MFTEIRLCIISNFRFNKNSNAIMAFMAVKQQLRCKNIYTQNSFVFLFICRLWCILMLAFPIFSLSPNLIILSIRVSFPHSEPTFEQYNHSEIELHIVADRYVSQEHKLVTICTFTELRQLLT